MPIDTISIDKFIADNHITMTCTRTDRNPSMDDSRDMDHWKCTLVRKTRRMTLTFSQGYGHNGAPPELASVLDCLASDAAGNENCPTFEDFCAEYGYDVDSRKAERTYKAVQHQSARLQTFLGDDLYQQLLYHTERQ